MLNQQYFWWCRGQYYECRSPFYYHGLTLIPACICNHIHYKVWDEITYPFPVQPLKFRNGWVISSHTLHGMWLLIHAGIKVNNIYDDAEVSIMSAEIIDHCVSKPSPMVSGIKNQQFFIYQLVGPGNAIRPHITLPTLVQLMVYCLVAPNNYLIQ